MRKRQDIELLRVLGAFGIVWFHSRASGWEFGYAGLMFFLIISLFFWAQSDRDSHGIGGRVSRLLVPWLFWFLFYGAANLATGKPFFPLERGMASGILAGSSIHLWYLPFIFLILVLFDRLRKWISAELLGYGCALAAIAVFVTSGLWGPWSREMGAPVAQYCQAIFGVLVGVFFGRYRVMSAPWRELLLLILIALTLGLYFVAGIGIPYIVGTTVAAVVLLHGVRLPERFNLEWLSASTLGIYLVHPFYLRLIGKVSDVEGMAYPILAFLLSALTIVLLRRYSPRAARYVA
jgi:fucose 4-O-acetylase-like acetyltransferase